jgi:integrase
MVVEQMLKTLHERKRSPRVLYFSHAILGRAMKKAVKWKQIPHNPVDGVDRPKWDRDTFKFWEPADALKFLEANQKDWLYALYDLALNTGMRQGELLGLHWEDVDFEEGTIHVHQQLNEVKGELLGFGPVKSKAGNRTIRLSSSSLASLRKHQEKLLAAGLRTSKTVFPTMEGGLYTKSHLIHRFHEAVARAGVPKMNFHALRHSNATMLVANGTDLRTVQGRLGHSQAAVTMKYAKFTKAADERAADLMESLIGKKK